MPKKIKLVAASKGNDAGTAPHGLAKAVGCIAEELRPLCHIGSLSGNIGELASALRNLANANAMSVIARSGTEEDRMIVVAYLKRWFKEFQE